MTAHDAARGQALAESGVHSPRQLEERALQMGSDPPWVSSTDFTEVAFAAGDFVFGQPSEIGCIWGRRNQVLWPSGEAFMVAGGQGLGKTTLAGLLLRNLVGLGEGKILGLPVIDTGRRILYLAMDRPKQIARSMSRQFTPEEWDLMNERVTIRPGPPPRDLAGSPLVLAQLAEYYGAGIVFVDSLKDGAIGLKEDEVGARYNRARQYLLAQGVELCELHHSVKAHSSQTDAATSIDRIYGSTWLTSGCGSVVSLAGDPGDPIVTFRHVKQPAEEVGPYRLLHDQAAGMLTIEHSIDLVALVRAQGVEGLTAKAAAIAISERPNPSRGAIEKARRRLDQLTADGVLARLEGTPSRDGGRVPVAWFLSDSQSRAIHEISKPAGRAITHPNTLETNHASITPITKNGNPQVEQSRTQSRHSRA